MGNVIVGGRQSIGDDVEDEISDFEHCFAASCEDATDGLLPPPLPGYTPSIGPPPTTRRGSKDTINEPLKGRLVTVHMLEREFLLKEAVGVVEQTVLRISYSSIQVLTWDHATSSLKVDHVATAVADDEHLAEEERGLDDRTDSSQPDLVFISVRVENSIDLEDELKQRARAEAVSARRAGRTPKAAPTSVYLGMFAGFTKPKPFQRKRPNLSFTVPEGKLPTLQEMRSWSHEEHDGISRPQLCSLRPKLAMDAVFLGQNRFPLSAVDGLSVSSTPAPDALKGSTLGELVLTFASVEVQLRVDCGENASFSYDAIDDWSLLVVQGKGPRPPSGLVLWLLQHGEEQEEGDGGHNRNRQMSSSSRSDEDDADAVDRSERAASEAESDAGAEMRVTTSRAEEDVHRGDRGLRHRHHRHHRRRRRRVFLGIRDEDLVLARNAMEYFWNSRRAELRLPPKAGSTHGRCVASMVTLRGEVEAPTLPTGRVDPIDLDGVEVRVGQAVHLSPKRGQLNLLPSPRALLGAEKKRTLRHNLQARYQWDRVVVHQGWLRKRGGGAIKRWIWRYFVLYDTPQGHFLAYYNDVSEVPLFSEARKERQLVDLCKVCFLRPEIGRQRLPGVELPPNAFTILTTERQWTLAADSRAAVLEWLRMISVAVDEDVAVVDDGEILFEVRAHWGGKQRGQYGPENPGTVHIGSMGMELRFGFSETTSTSLAALGGHPRKRTSYSASDANDVTFWSFTDFYKWTVVLLSDGVQGLAVQCFTDDQFEEKEDVLLVTPNAKQLALAIEHQVEKFMSVMHLRLERPDDMSVPDTPAPSSRAGTASTSTGTSLAVVPLQASTHQGGRGSDTAVEPLDAAQTHRSETEEIHRAPSMNLATDPSLWVGDATITPGAPGRQASDGSGGINPFDSSSDEGSEEEGATPGSIGARGDGPVDGKPDEGVGEACRPPISKGSNPFDISVFEEVRAAAPVGGAGGRREDGAKTLQSAAGGAGETPLLLMTSEAPDAAAAAAAAAAVFPDDQPSRICEEFPLGQFFTPAAAAAAAADGTAPSPTGLASTTTGETCWPATIDPCASTPLDANHLRQQTEALQETPNLDLGALKETPNLDLGALQETPNLDLALVESPSITTSSPARPLDFSGVSSVAASDWPPVGVASPGEATRWKRPEEWREKRLPPTPLMAFDAAEGVSACPSPTPPVTPFPAPPPKAPVDLYSAFRDTVQIPSPSDAQANLDLFSAFQNPTEVMRALPPTKEQADLHLAFRDNATDTDTQPSSSIEKPPGLHAAFSNKSDALKSPDVTRSRVQGTTLALHPELTRPIASLIEAGSSPEVTQDFNPFGRPGSSVLSQSAGAGAPAPDKVLYDNGSSIRVISEECVKTGRTCDLTLRYELRVPPKTTFCVEFPETVDSATSSPSSSSALQVSFDPRISCTELGDHDEGNSRSTKELRQVLSVTCLRAFSSPPEIALTTSDQPLTTIRVPLPMVTVAAFLTGLAVDPEEFRLRWTALACSEQDVLSGEEAQQQQPLSYQGGCIRDTTVVTPADIRRLLVESLGMREVVQQRPAGAVAELILIAAAGEILCTPDSASGNVAAGGTQGAGSTTAVCLVGIELHCTTGAARITTKSAEPLLAQCVQKEVLGGVRQLRLSANTNSAQRRRLLGSLSG